MYRTPAAAFAPAAALPYGPDTCVNGYVWREAFDGDAVCARPLSQQAHAFIDALAASDRATYSLGVAVGASPQGRNVFHSGNWPGSTAVPQRFGSYFASWNGGVAVTVTFDSSLDNDQQAALDTALRRAAGIA